MNETELERDCVELAKRRGYQHRKLDTGFGAKGWLDHAFWGPGGRHFIVEFKVDRNRMSVLQRRKFRRFKNDGHEVYEIRSVEAFERLL